MRVLHVGEIVRGGVATYLRALVPAQCRALGDNAVAGVIPERFVPDLEGIFPRLWTCRCDDRSMPALWRLFRTIQRAIVSFEPDVIHAHSTFPGVLVRLCVALIPPARRPKVVYCAHGWAFLRVGPAWKNRIYGAIERILEPLADAIIHISADEAAGARRYGLARGRMTNRHSVVYNGLDDCSTPGSLPTEGLHLLFVGRLDVQKGFDIFRDALASTRRPDLTVHVAGASVVPGQAMALSTAGIDHVRLVAHEWLAPDALRRLYGAVHAVIMPSRWEGFGFVAVEAMRAGRAVIASCRGALPEIVVDGVTGALFDPDRPEDLAALIDAASVSLLLAQGGQGRRRFLDRFTAGLTHEAVMAVYHHLVTIPTPSEAPLGSRAATVK